MGTSRRERGARVALWCVLTLATATVVLGLVASAQLEFNDNIYAPYQFAIGFPCVIVGGYITHRRVSHPIGWALIAAGWANWMTASASTIFPAYELPIWTARLLLLLGLSGWLWGRGLVQIIVPQLYPDGIAKALWRRVALGLSLALTLATGLVNALPIALIDVETEQSPEWTLDLASHLVAMQQAMFVLAVLANVDLVVRVVRMKGEEARRHRAVAIAAVVLALPGLNFMAEAAGYDIGDSSEMVEFIAGALLPVALAYGVLRHGVLGFDTVVRRTALYAGVTAIAAAIYVAVVWGFSAVVQDGAGAGPVVATGIIAVTLQPVRALVQRVLDRRVFGDRDEPYRALATLGRRLELAGDGVETLTVVTDTVRDSLRLPYTAIELELDGEMGTSAESGEPISAVERFPLVHGGRTIGNLVVGLPPGESSFGAHERELLEDFARAITVVAHSLQLAWELGRSRERLVRAREEERRRLRRDLHDGLGPTMASVALGLDAAASRLSNDPTLSSLLADLDRELHAAIADLRRLVQGLRPPALDDLGLVPALRQHAGELTARSGGSALSIDVVADDDLPKLGAAVEVAAFRIALEGMTNVVRHAGASHCIVRIRATDVVEVEVEDDGCGVRDGASNGPRRGVGLESMRERAVELGGELTIAPGDRGGTVVRAVLPLEDRLSV